MDKWWIDFFDEQFASYFLNRKDLVLLEKEYLFLNNVLNLKKSDCLLDQCCGVGSLSIKLAQEIGLDIVGIDQNENYIHEAKQLQSSLGIKGDFFVADAYEFIAKPSCDVVINWYASFGYSRDDLLNLKMLQNAYQSLKPGGSFVLDYYNIIQILLNFETEQHISLSGDKEQTLLKTSTVDLVDGMLISHWFWENQVVKSGESRMYYPCDLKNMLISCGFKHIQFYGSINGDFLSTQSPRCILVAKK